ncbi:MAG: hypothetical protein AB7O45_02430 [Alphaproteobacteria bacterium]
MPLRLIGTAMREAQACGTAVYDADVGILADTDLLEPLIDAICAAGLQVRLCGRPDALRRLGLHDRVPVAGALVRADPTIRPGTMRFWLHDARATSRVRGRRASAGLRTA